ncbi:MAG: hypothetical protein QXF45_02060 [Candidatus Caldarchaeum sp.]
MIEKLLKINVLFAPAFLSLMTLSRIELSNPFVLVGLLSLIIISSTERFKWAGIVFVYVPAGYCVYLLLTGVVSPFLGLAAGYIISTPFVLLISAYRSINMIGLVSGYYASYMFALLLNNAVGAGGVQPERLFITVIRNLLGLFTAERINVTPSVPEPAILYNSLAALATFSLIIFFVLQNNPRKPEFNTYFVKSLAAVAGATLLVVGLSDLWPPLSTYILLAVVVGLLAFTAWKMRE